MADVSYALSPYYGSSVRNQASDNQLLTGQALSPQALEGITSGELDARYNANIQQQQIGEQQRLAEQGMNIQQGQYQQQYALQMKELKSKEQASTVAGIGQIALLGGTALKNAPEMMAGAQALGGALGIGATAAEGAGALGTMGGAIVGDAALGVPGAIGEFGAMGAGALEAGAGAAAGIGAGEAAAAYGVGDMLGAIGSFLGDAAMAVIASIICTELHRQGFISARILVLTNEYRRRYVSREEYIGYLIVSAPIVRLMQRSTLFSWAFRPIGCAFAYGMASRVSKRVKGSLLGDVTMWAMRKAARYAYKRRAAELREVI
jgi:hypothetical protein